MKTQLRYALVEKLIDVSRKEPLEEALLEFGELATGTRGFLACDGLAIHDASTSMIVMGNGNQITADTVSNYSDFVLEQLGLAIGQVQDLYDIQRKPSVLCLALRMGLLLRILDMSFAHLEGRVSFGHPTLKHQLVRAAFGEAFGATVQIRQRIMIRLETDSVSGIDADQRLISEQTSHAEKLMGGHGYLLGGTHSISYLSTLLYSVYA